MHKEKLKLLISKEKIAAKIQEIAAILNKEYEGKELVIVMVMKGSFFLTADLVRHLHMPLVLEYIRASSYGMRGISSGDLIIQGVDDLDIKDKHVLIIDDIFDSGQTMTGVTKELKTKKPASIKSLVLLLKEINRPMKDLPNHFLFKIQDQFVVGYGLDYKEHYRHLPDVYELI